MWNQWIHINYRPSCRFCKHGKLYCNCYLFLCMITNTFQPNILTWQSQFKSLMPIFILWCHTYASLLPTKQANREHAWCAITHGCRLNAGDSVTELSHLTTRFSRAKETSSEAMRSELMQILNLTQSHFLHCMCLDAWGWCWACCCCRVMQLYVLPLCLTIDYMKQPVMFKHRGLSTESINIIFTVQLRC